MPNSTGFRVFMSYSHSDEALVAKLEYYLKRNGLTVMRDKHFAYGVGFHDQIRRFIEYAHVFMPVITAESSRRGWVHQEIGYAIAQNVPVLPVAIDWEPREWLQTLHSVILTKKQVDNEPNTVREIFSRELFRELVRRFGDDRFAVYTCGPLQEDRTRMLVDYADEVARIQALIGKKTDAGETCCTGQSPGVGQAPEVGKTCDGGQASDAGKTCDAGDSSESLPDDDPPLSSRVRQKGALSSFHIPDEPLSSSVWEDRYGRFPKPEHHCRLQREERQSLTRHAEKHGCRLIIDPSIPYTDQGPKVRQARLESLLLFLRSDVGQRAEIVINKQMSRTESVTIVGSWFMATTASAEAGKGYYQTIFTRHAPSIQARIEEFDDEFNRLLVKNYAPKEELPDDSHARKTKLEELAKESCRRVIAELEETIAKPPDYFEQAWDKFLGPLKRQAEAAALAEQEKSAAENRDADLMDVRKTLRKVLKLGQTEPPQE
jgi:hypothetical protein